TGSGCTAVEPERIYGTHPVREALRGRREVFEVWCTERAKAHLDWLPGAATVVRGDRLEELAGSPDHQGVAAAVAPYPYAEAERLLPGGWPVLIAPDEVPDPHTLGAVAGVAEAAGADGMLITRRRSAAVTAAVCKASAGAVEHLPIAQVENL